MRTEKKHELAKKRHWRIRKKIIGSVERPRMSVCMTEKHIYVQFVDDAAGRTVAAVSTRKKSLRDSEHLAANVKSAKRIGFLAAEAAKTAGIDRVVFDRGVARFHGKLKALADAAREAGLRF